MTSTVDDVRAAAGRMVDLAARSSDRMSALDSVARKCGTGPRALRRFIEGQTKAVGLTVFTNIREAYRRTLIRKIEEFQAELRALDEQDQMLDVWDIDLKLAALEMQIQERKEQLSHASSSRS